MRGDEGRTVLVVDDTAELRQAYVDILEAEGYHVVAASSGEDALAEARRCVPDLVITDIVMPEMDGFELLARLRGELGAAMPPAIVCSGFDVTELEARRRGAQMFVRKPADRLDLLWAVDMVEEGRRLGAAPGAADSARAQRARRAAHESALAEAGAIDRAGLEDRARVALQWLRRYFACASAAVLVPSQDSVDFLVVAGARVAPRPAAQLPGALEPLSAVLQTGSPLLVGDLSVHPCFRATGAGMPGVRFLAAVPLARPRGGATFGVVCLADEAPRVFHAGDLSILEHFARHGSLVADALLTRETPPGERLIDHAGVLAREAFVRLLGLELQASRRVSAGLELMMLDLEDEAAMAGAARALGDGQRGERTALGRMHATRLAVFARVSPAPDGGSGTLERGIGVLDSFRAATIVTIADAAVPPLSAETLIGMAEQLLTGTGVEARDRPVRRLVLRVDGAPMG